MARKIRKLWRIVILISFWIVIQIGVLIASCPDDPDLGEICNEAGDIVITEFSLKTAGDVYQYLEIFNTRVDSIDLKKWEIEYIDINNFEKEVEINSSLTIPPGEFVVFTGMTGRFKDSNGLEKVPENAQNWSWENGGWDEFLQPNFYWTKFILNPSTGHIVIKDSTGKLIDEVTYDVDAEFPIEETGKSVEFILDPTDDSSFSLNNTRLNWRASNYESSMYLYNKFGVLETGSPNRMNFTEVIFQDKYDENQTEWKPEWNGYPGGEATVTLDAAGSGTIDNQSYEWEIMGETLLGSIILGTSSNADTTFLLPKDSSPDSNIFYITLTVTDSLGIMGKIDTSIVVYEEDNDHPVVDSLTIYVFEQDSVILTPDTIYVFHKDTIIKSSYALVTDTELCDEACSDTDALTYHWYSDNLDVTSFSTSFQAPEIDSNNIDSTYQFLLTVSDPFDRLNYNYSSRNSNTISVIVNNYNIQPEINLESENIIDLDIIAGYSCKLAVSENKIELHELDASGIEKESIIIANIDDDDDDATFSVILLGQLCNDGFDSLYCVDGNMIMTRFVQFGDFTYDSLSLLIQVSDNSTPPGPLLQSVPNNYNLSDTVQVNIGGIRFLKPVIDFESIEKSNDNKYYLPEDITDVAFNIKFNLDAEFSHDFNAMNLQWFFTSLNSVVNGAKETDNESNILNFKINSLVNDFNGDPKFNLFVTDTSNQISTISDTINIPIPIYVKQQNDKPLSFSIQPELFAYNYNVIDTTAFYIESDSLYYFRLPQEMNLSVDFPDTLRFQWEKNDTLDIDTDPELNLGDSLHLYYRLEAVVNDTFIILEDRIDHGDFEDIDYGALEDEEFIFADISMTDEFPFYSSVYSNNIKDEIALDISGSTVYKWRVVAQNYWEDDLGNDPVQISSRWDSTNFKIDLIPPQVTDYNIMMDPMYPGYYDILWETNGSYLTDSTFLNINEDSNLFGAISQRNPRRITDSLYHFTGIMPSELSSASINFNLQMRDRAMNAKDTTHEVSYIHYDPHSESSFSSPSGLANISIKKTSIDQPIDIFAFEEQIKVTAGRNTSDIYQLTSSVHFFPQNISLINNGMIDFNIHEYLSPEIYDWQYVIMEMNDEGHQKLNTYFKDGNIFAYIDKLSSFAVYVNLNITRSLPTLFKLKENYPNPFNPQTIIPLEIPVESYVKAAIYNILGQEVFILIDGIQSPGYQNLQWHGKDHSGQRVSSGIYFVRVQYNKKMFIQKMMLLK